MNNVLKDSLFVSQNRKFDEIQSVVRQFSAEYVGNSIIKDNIFAVIQNYARKKEIALELLRFPIHDDELWALTFLKQDTIFVPKLVVGLTIDQLRTDYIEAFSALYGERGFKRLWKEGRIYLNAEYDFINVDKSSSVAAIYSGTTPYTNGIVGDNWMDRATLRVINCVDDNNFMGIYTSESTSPAKLKVSNLSDELAVATQGVAEVYSIAPTREMAVLAAGHAAKGAFWINDETGKWSGSTYYGTFPSWISTYNDYQGLDFRISDMVWGPYLPVTAYKYLTTETKQLTFKHNFDDERKQKYRRLKTSPYANDEVNRLVNACLNSTSIGKDNVPDLLSLAGISFG